MPPPEHAPAHRSLAVVGALREIYGSSENATIRARLSAEAMSKAVSSMVVVLIGSDVSPPTPLMQFGCQLDPQDACRISAALLARIWHNRSVIQALASTPGRRAFRDMPMPMNANDIEKLIKDGIPDAEVTIRDLAGDGDHYAATVLAESFRGKSRVQQHQLVYNALKGQMGGALHALALQTGLPEG